jgi:CYTH domain-containing protein
MEIERKYLIKELPEQLSQYPSQELEQGYLNTEPVVRIRRQDEEYFLTYKSKGLMVREEYNLPLTAQAYAHLREKVDGQLITKTRYRIPLEDGHTIELDIFHGSLEPLQLAEVEFETKEEALAFTPPAWFGEDVTFTGDYHNSRLAQVGLPKGGTSSET